MSKSTRQPFFIVNPQAANGRLGREWESVEEEIRRFFDEYDFEFTACGGDATRIAAQAVADGREFIVSCGGDGTNNEVLNGLVRENTVPADVTLGFVPFGTGGDFRRTLDLMGGLDQALKTLARGEVKPIDIGRIDFIDDDGDTASRYFLNIASAGLGGTVDRIVNNSSKRLGGKTAFMIGTMKGLAKYKPQEVTITIDDEPVLTCPVQNVAVANGKFFGGGMKMAPDAVLDDGLFDVVVIHKTSLVNSLLSLRDTYKGTHLKHPWFSHRRGRVVRLESDGEVLLDVDGEAPGRLPATFTNLHNVLPIVVPGPGHR